MSSSSNAPTRARDERREVRGDWGSTLPELAGVTTAAMDPSRIEEAMREGYSKGLAAGRADGYEAGYAEGERAGLAALEQDRRNLASALALLGHQLGQLGAAEEALRASFDQAVVDTAMAIAEAIVARELTTASDPGREAILRAFAVAPTSVDTATVRLHPVDADRLGDVTDVARAARLTVVPDPSVEPGGCILQLGDTAVDATIGAALARVREVLR